MATMVTLISSDNRSYEVELAVAECSTTIKTMLEDLGVDSEPIPLLNVNSAILEKVLEWAEHHKDDAPSPPESDNEPRKTDDISPWDKDFIDVDQGTLFELILAANYLDIKKLLDLTCKSVANLIKGKSPEEIRKTFNIPNDFSPEEEAEARKSNEWAEPSK